MNRSTERQVVAAGHVVYAQGERAACAYLLLRGSVELRTTLGGQTSSLGLRKAGEIFGDLALVDDSVRQATAVARDACEMLVITGERLSDQVGGVDPLLRLCLSSIVTRYSEAIEQIRRHVDKPTTPHVLEVWTAHAEAAHAMLSLEHQLRDGIERDELELHFQPIVHLATGRLAGFEGLIRWRHPQRGLLLPLDFVSLAEASGAILDITALCLREMGKHYPAIRSAAARNPAVADRPFISVNVSAIDLMQVAFATKTIAALRAAGIDPEDVRLEVTESILMRDAENCARTLQNCRDQGLTIAMDDFGTGYSSLHYLNALPISTLKMDQSFCQSLLAERTGRKIIGAILHLGRELGLSVIAEGVELAAQRDLLASMGCDFGQGFLFGAAVGATDTVDLLKTWQAMPAASAAPPPIAPAA